MTSLVLIVMMFLWTTYSMSKMEKSDFYFSSPFECGFQPFFFCRLSFSIHYYLVILIFLMLDLEICLIFPSLMMEYMNLKIYMLFFSFVSILLMALLMEWKMGGLEWAS